MPRLPVLFILAPTQIAGWGVTGILPVIAARVAAEFAVTLPVVFGGTTAMFVAMALAAPAAGRRFLKHGTRQVMAAGAGLTGLGLCLLAVAPNLAVFLGAWVLIGLAGAMFLTTAAYAYLADHAGARARGLIGALMLVTGLAGSLFWPLTAFLEGLIGWRGAALSYAAIMLVVVCPLIRFGLPGTAAAVASTAPPGRFRRGPVLFLLVAAITLNSFVTFGIETIGIELFRAMGADLGTAVAIAAALGAFKVAGRVIDFLGGARWSAMSTALAAGAMIPLGLAAAATGATGVLSVGAYLFLFGIGSGAFAVARATMPLIFYDSGDYAAAMSVIALPMNLINAFAPPLLAALLTSASAHAVPAFLGGLSAAAFVLLLRLAAIARS